MNEQPRRFRIGRRGWLAVALVALGLGAAGVAAAPPALVAHARHGFGHLRHGHHGPHSWSEEDIAFAVAFALRNAEASEEQLAALTAIATRAAGELAALHGAFHARHEAFTQALVGADRAALEALRREELARLDAASQRLVAALADAAEQLTPEQRQRLAAAHAERHHGE
jgi:hypothetical protein